MSTALHADQLQHFVPFDELSIDIIEGLIPHFEIRTLAAKKILFKRGEDDDLCHFLLSGQLDLADDQFNISGISADDDENFLALDSSHRIHRCSAISQTECVIASIKRQYLELITTWSELHQAYQQEHDTSDWLEGLLTSGVFNQIPPAHIQTLLTRFQPRSVTLGERIIQQGERGNECYVIKRGKAIVSHLKGAKEETLAALAEGDLFGEDSLISDMPRNAHVTMSSDGELMVLTKDDFDTLLKQPVLQYITESELALLISEADTGIVLLDVRQPREAALDPIHRAQNIPLANLRHRLSELSDAFIYVLIGDARSDAAAYILSEAGLQARILRRDSVAPSAD